MAVVYAKKSGFIGRRRIKKGDAYDTRSPEVEMMPSAFSGEPAEVHGRPESRGAVKPRPKAEPSPVVSEEEPQEPQESEMDDPEPDEESEVEESEEEEREERPRPERATRAPGERRTTKRPTKRAPRRQ